MRLLRFLNRPFHYMRPKSDLFFGSNCQLLYRQSFHAALNEVNFDDTLTLFPLSWMF